MPCEIRYRMEDLRTRDKLMLREASEKTGITNVSDKKNYMTEERGLMPEAARIFTLSRGKPCDQSEAGPPGLCCTDQMWPALISSSVAVAISKVKPEQISAYLTERM